MCPTVIMVCAHPLISSLYGSNEAKEVKEPQVAHRITGYVCRLSGDGWGRALPSHGSLPSHGLLDYTQPPPGTLPALVPPRQPVQHMLHRSQVQALVCTRAEAAPGVPRRCGVSDHFGPEAPTPPPSRGKFPPLCCDQHPEAACVYLKCLTWRPQNIVQRPTSEGPFLVHTGTHCRVLSIPLVLGQVI